MKWFDGDEVRGVAITELTCEFCMQAGRAAVMVIPNRNNRKIKIVVGKDTRDSSDILESALCAGIASLGAKAICIGVVPTAALTYTLKEQKADAGIMISASHRSSEYNALRFYGSDGMLLPEDDEEKIEKYIFDYPEKMKAVAGENIGEIIHDKNAIQQYEDYIVKSIGMDFKGMKIAVDCANGSAFKTAGAILNRLGADVILLNNTPDGKNINKKCGSTHMRDILSYVPEHKCNAGFALDGDGDRVLAVDENGDLIDGDNIIAICASDMKKEGKLNNDGFVVTLMSNLGLFRFAKLNEIKAEYTNSGEKNLIERIVNRKYSIGGESNGNIIFPEIEVTGDGTLTAAKILCAMKKSEKKLSELKKIMEKFPQVMLNVRIRPNDREIWKNDYIITGKIEKCEAILGDEGRVLVRESGNEPLIRIMIEGRDFRQINQMAMDIADTIKMRVGKDRRR